MGLKSYCLLMDFTKLRGLLDNEYNWPQKYTFKFVGTPEHRAPLSDCLGQEPCQERASRSGKYISFTFHIEITATHEVISIYEEVAKISGIISL